MRGPDCRLFCPAVMYCKEYADNREQHARVALVDIHLTRQAVHRSPANKGLSAFDNELRTLVSGEIQTTEQKAGLMLANADRARGIGEEIMSHCSDGVLVEHQSDVLACQSTYPGTEGFTHERYMNFVRLLPRPPIE